jgi:hypothetical protein
MTYLPQLKAELVKAIPQDVPRRGRLRRPLALVIAAALAAGATTGALAATGVIAIGAPIHDAFGLGNTDPHRGNGVIVPGSVRLLSVRVADPVGGPPWGMRVIGTTRGVGCIQVGRVVDGKLGTLGRDGVAGDDGRFHELPATAVDPWDCEALDAAGNLFVSVAGEGFMASGPSEQRSCLGPGSHAGPDDAIQRHCPAGDQRAMAYGLLGPRAKTITYRAASRAHTISVTSPDGAYLIVTRSHRDIGGVVGGARPTVAVTPRGQRDYVLRRITYANARPCPPRIRGFRPAIVTCPLVGFTRPRGSAPTSDEVATALHVHTQSVGTKGPKGAHVTVEFRAPVATAGASNFYELEIHLPRTGRCRELFATPQRSQTDLAQGDAVRLTASIPAGCPGTTRARVRLVTLATTTTGAPPLFASVPSGGPTVGHFTIDVP